MSVPGIAKSLFENLRNLLAVPYAILLLAFLTGANLALNRCFGLALPQTFWDVLKKQISIGEALMFLCLMIFYMTTVANAMRWLFVECSVDIILKVQEWYRRLNDIPNTRRPPDDYVFKYNILKKANSEANLYYLDVYRKHKEACDSEESESWQLSSHALGCITLLLIDIAWDGRQSVLVFIYTILRDKFNTTFAVVFVGIVGFVILGAVLAPIFTDSSPWIYCPGFPKSDESTDENVSQNLTSK